MMRILSIDLGTTYLKGGVLDLETQVVQSTVRRKMPDPIEGLHPLFYEIDPKKLVDAVEALIQQLMQTAPEADTLMMCSQMHGMVLLNECGQPCSNAITWRDQRSALTVPGGSCSYLDVVSEALGAKRLRGLGNELRPGIPVGTLVWLEREENLPAGPLTVVSLPDFVLSQLSGQPACVDATNAASYGLFNVCEGRWSRESIAALELRRFKFPPVADFCEVAYQIKRSGRVLNCHTPVGDHQCALAGAQLRPNELSVNVATGSQVSVLSREFAEGEFQVRPYFGGAFLLIVTHIPAGRALQSLVDLLTELPRRAGINLGDPWALIEQALREDQTGEPLVVDLSFFGSEDAPAGSLSNIDENNFNVGELFRAAFEKMADDYGRHARELRQFTKVERIVFSGGVIQKCASLRSLVEESIGLPSRLAEAREDTMLGMLKLARRIYQQ